MRPTHLGLPEAEAIHILRDEVAEARNPVILLSGGKDSTVLAHLAVRAFHPGRCPAPLLHIDSTYEFRDVLAFRDRFAKEHGFSLLCTATRPALRRASTRSSMATSTPRPCVPRR
jgi:sulfate adenylyltransferase subunit 2